MKIALTYPKSEQYNPLFKTALESFMFLNELGYSASFISHNELTDEYDGYVFVSDYIDHKIKAKVFLDNKPCIIISGCVFDHRNSGRVRLLFNGITPNFGTWNLQGSEDYWNKLNIKQKTSSGDSILICPNNFYTDISFGKNMMEWVVEQVEEYGKEVIVKFHPKYKTRKDLDVARNFKGAKTIVREKSTDNLSYRTIVTYSSTASVEGAIKGANVIAKSPGDFMFRHSLLDCAGCVWKISELKEAFLLNKYIFDNAITDFYDDKFRDTVMNWVEYRYATQ